MILNAKDANGNDWNETVLHGLGASTIAWPSDQNGPTVEPDIDISGYLAALQTYVPSLSCTKRQLLLAFLGVGKSEEDIVAAIDTISNDDLRKRAVIAWQYPDNGMLNRQHSVFDQIVQPLGLTSQDLTGLFMAAQGT